LEHDGAKINPTPNLLNAIYLQFFFKEKKEYSASNWDAAPPYI
jgi:hypothetical protein